MGNYGYNEAQHPRARDGKFAGHVGAAQPGSLTDTTANGGNNSRGFPARAAGGRRYRRAETIRFRPEDDFDRVYLPGGPAVDYGFQWTHEGRSRLRVSHDPTTGTLYAADDQKKECALVAEGVNADQVETALKTMGDDWKRPSVTDLLDALPDDPSPQQLRQRPFNASWANTPGQRATQPQRRLYPPGPGRTW